MHVVHNLRFSIAIYIEYDNIQENYFIQSKTLLRRKLKRVFDSNKFIGSY